MSAPRGRERERESDTDLARVGGVNCCCWIRVGTPNWLFANLELNSLNTCQNIQFTVFGMLVIGFCLLPHVHFALLNNFICDFGKVPSDFRCKVCNSVTICPFLLSARLLICVYFAITLLLLYDGKVSSKGDTILVQFLFCFSDWQEDQKENSHSTRYLILWLF